MNIIVNTTTNELKDLDMDAYQLEKFVGDQLENSLTMQDSDVSINQISIVVKGE